MCELQGFRQICQHCLPFNGYQPCLQVFVCREANQMKTVVDLISFVGLSLCRLPMTSPSKMSVTKFVVSYQTSDKFQFIFHYRCNDVTSFSDISQDIFFLFIQFVLIILLHYHLHHIIKKYKDERLEAFYFYIFL